MTLPKKRSKADPPPGPSNVSELKPALQVAWGCMPSGKTEPDDARLAEPPSQATIQPTVQPAFDHPSIEPWNHRSIQLRALLSCEPHPKGNVAFAQGNTSKTDALWLTTQQGTLRERRTHRSRTSPSPCYKGATVPLLVGPGCLLTAILARDEDGAIPLGDAGASQWRQCARSDAVTGPELLASALI